MSSYLYHTYKFLQHSLTARHSYGFGIHSPYIYHFTKFIVYEKNPFYVFPAIEALRDSLKKDDRVISVTDFGTGRGGDKRVKSIAGKSLKSPKFGQLLFRIANFCKCNVILELGTSLGLTTAYFATTNEKCRCVTMEGCSQTAKIARDNFDKLQLNNIELVIGDIDENLPSLVKSIDCIDLLFIDANHRSEAVLRYFEECLPKIHDKSVVIIDDIYWSKDMEFAWKTIKNRKEVTATIDLFQVGIVFFNPELHKKNYKMWF